MLHTGNKSKQPSFGNIILVLCFHQKNMIIVAVTLIQRWYSTKERNKQHIHYLKLERTIFILSHQGEIPENIQSCLFWGCDFTAGNHKCESPGGRPLVGRAHLCREGEEEDVLPGRAGTQLQKMAFLQLTEAQDTLRSILYATVVCKSKSSVIIGKFRYNVN